MRSDMFIAEHAVQPSAGSGMSVQNSYPVPYVLDGQMIARQGGVRT